MSTLTEVTSEADFTSRLNTLPSTTLAVLYFHTTWAAPCANMRTVLSTLAAQYQPSTPPSITFLSVNAEDLPDISEDYDVTAVPFVVLVRDGQILESISGSDAVNVRDAVERHAGGGSGTAGTAAPGTQATIPPALAATPRAGNEPTTATKVPDGSAAGAEQTKEALFARLADLVKAAPVMLFMKGSPSSPQCGFSRQLVGILRERSVKYGFFNILADEDIRQGLKEFAEWPTFPQLWVKGELVGGLDIVCLPVFFLFFMCCMLTDICRSGKNSKMIRLSWMHMPLARRLLRRLEPLQSCVCIILAIYCYTLFESWHLFN